MAVRVKRVLSMGLQPEAMCDNCGWAHRSSSMTRDAAKAHVKDTGHDVLVETVTRDLYKVVEE